MKRFESIVKYCKVLKPLFLSSLVFDFLRKTESQFSKRRSLVRSFPKIGTLNVVNLFQRL